MSHEHAALAEITSAVIGAGPHQGDVVWWDLSSSEIPATDFLRRWKGEGLDPDLLPKVPPPARALRDAGQEVLKGHGNKKGEYLMRPAGEAGGSYFYALVNEKRLTAGSNGYKQDATFEVQPGGQLQVTVTYPECGQVVRAIEGAYRRIAGTYQSRDIREAVNKVLRDGCYGAKLRDHGGLYWIPSSFHEVVLKVKAVIDSVGASYFSVLPIHGTAIGTAAIQRAARQSLEETLNEIKSELDGWSMEVAHGDGPRPSTVNRRIEDFADLKAKADLYKDILSLQVNDLEVKLSAAQQQAAKILLGISDD